MKREKSNRNRFRPWLLVLLVWTAPALAQEVEEVPSVLEPYPQVDEGFLSFYGGVHFGSPLRLSGALTIIWDIEGKDDHSFDVGPSLRLEAGLSGAKVALGYTGAGYYLSGLSIRAAALWTRDWMASPLEAPVDTTYLGAEYSMTLFMMTGTAGVYRSVSGPDDSWLIGWSVGFGF